MEDVELLKALSILSVETGSLACLGCGHEHNCGIYGCAIIRAATDYIAALQAENAELRRKDKLPEPPKENDP